MPEKPKLPDLRGAAILAPVGTTASPMVCQLVGGAHMLMYDGVEPVRCAKCANVERDGAAACLSCGEKLTAWHIYHCAYCMQFFNVSATARRQGVLIQTHEEAAAAKMRADIAGGNLTPFPSAHPSTEAPA